MTVFAFLLILLFATQTWSRHHGLSHSNRRLDARAVIVELPDEDRKPLPKIVNPYEGNNYDGDGYKVDWEVEEGAEEVAAEKPPWETHPLFDEGTVYEPLKERPTLGDTGLVLSKPVDGKESWLAYLGEDVLGKLELSLLDRARRWFFGEDSRQKQRAAASRQIEYIQQRFGGNLRSVVGNLEKDIQELFQSSLDPIDQAEVVQRYPWIPALAKFYKELDAEQGKLPVQFIDNRIPSEQDPSSASGSRLPSNFGDYPQYGPIAFDRKRKRSDVLGIVTGAEQSGNSNSTMNRESKYELYFDAFTAAQSNASVILFPIIEEMISRSNSSLVWNAAWSLFADLTGSSPVIVGPFSFGFNCIQSLEDAAFALIANSSNLLNQTAVGMNGTNATTWSKNLIMATTFGAIEIYNEGWANATAALNNKNLIQIMKGLATNLSPSDASIIPSQFLTNRTSYDKDYFLEYAHWAPGKS